jgi:hypothetical protein
MKNIFFKVITILGISLIVLGAAYKWVDEEGNVHYSDKAPTTENAHEIEIESGSSQGRMEEAQQRAEKIKQTEKMLRESRESTRLKKDREKQLALHRERMEKVIQLANEFGGTWSSGIDLDAQCNEKFGMDCDDLLGWKERAVEKCREEHDKFYECSYENYLYKYKPVPIDIQRQIGVQRRRARER